MRIGQPISPKEVSQQQTGVDLYQQSTRSHPSQPERVMVAMSGGVDSSVAARLLLDQGYDVMGVTMRLFDKNDLTAEPAESCSSCSHDDIADAQAVAHRLGIEHKVVDYQTQFASWVIDRFCSSYLAGNTPNPCVDCNRCLKFGALQRYRAEEGYDYVATGHYVRRVYDQQSGRYLLKKAHDPKKDQSYVLYQITQDQLAHTLFPLGDLDKNRVRESARDANLSVAEKLESQDICFIPDGDYASFIERHCGHPLEPGPILDEEGRVLGEHNGLARYTIGQRKGLGVAAGEPLFVLRKDVERNALVVGPASSTGVQSVFATNVNLIALPSLHKSLRVEAKTNYRSVPRSGIARIVHDELRVDFDEPIRAAAPGQALVIYQGEVLIGGGTITHTE